MPIENKATILNILIEALILINKGRYILAKQNIEKAIKKLEE